MTKENISIIELIENTLIKIETTIQKENSLNKPQKLLNQTFQENNLTYNWNNNNSDNLQKAYILLDQSFIEEKEKKELRNKLQDTQDKRNNLLAQCSNTSPFPPTKALYNYLKSYYLLLVTCLSLKTELKNSQLLSTKFLELIIELDSNKESLSLYSPQVLLSIQNLYNNINDYYQTVTNIDKQDKIYYRQILLQNIKDTFQWLAFKEQQPYITNPFLTKSNSSTLNTPLLPIESLQKINELEILEKILPEIKERIQNHHYQEDEINITIIGEISPEKLIQISKWLEKYIDQTSYQTDTQSPKNKNTFINNKQKR